MTTPANWEQFQEDMGRWQAAAEDLARRYEQLIDVAASGELGALAYSPDLSSAPMGSLSEMQRRLQIQNVAGRGTVGSGTRINLEGANGWGLSQSSYTGSLNDLKTPGSHNILAVNTTDTPKNFQNSSGVAVILVEGGDSYLSQTFKGVRSPGTNRLSGEQLKRSFYGDTQTWSQWITSYSTNNCTVDSNGFLKAASPIFRLSNTAEPALADDLNFVEAGAGAANNEAPSVTATHDDTGVYRIHGSLGFATEGWTINLPQDANGNRLVFVKTEESDDGTITVRTYTRKPNLETLTFEAGDPVDIPDGRWIDLRLSMPEPEQPDDPAPEPENLDPTTAA